tara:strand:+ start:15038 stop:16030 length:993 start_codon:yes stop_codon:yes gene_type:complete
MAKTALFYRKLKSNDVKCTLCPNNCLIKSGSIGICKVRKNTGGKLVSLVYGKPCSVNIDPIEKKPIFHLLPGSKVFSVGTVGCNLHCGHCQNWEISQSDKIFGSNMDPKEVVDEAIAKKCKSIAYTYTEPTIFYEYALDIAKLAKRKGLKNIMVTNGYINQEPLKKLYRYIDAANVDFKAFDNDFYVKCGGRLDPVLDSIKMIQKLSWLELTNLIIPGLNSSPRMISSMVDWIDSNLGKDVPLHLSKFFPNYKMQDIPPTDVDVLMKAYDVARNKLNHVYVGNVVTEKAENTYCSSCGNMVIERKSYTILKNKLSSGKCYSCGNVVKGVW